MPRNITDCSDKNRNTLVGWTMLACRVRKSTLTRLRRATKQHAKRRELPPGAARSDLVREAICTYLDREYPETK